MHFEVLVEDKSGSIALDAILEKILGRNGSDHFWRIHPYKGVGRIPRNLHGVTAPRKRILLDRLPLLLRGYGKSLQYPSIVIVVVDLDDRDCNTFKQELLTVLNSCWPRPETLFGIAIEESEAWLLGDLCAVRRAYPKARNAILRNYVQDSICGTWEVLADAVHPGGSLRLRKLGYPEAGKAKCEWAKRIAAHMDLDKNQSRSLQIFRDSVRNLVAS